MHEELSNIVSTHFQQKKILTKNIQNLKKLLISTNEYKDLEIDRYGSIIDKDIKNDFNEEGKVLLDFLNDESYRTISKWLKNCSPKEIVVKNVNILRKCMLLDLNIFLDQCITEKWEILSIESENSYFIDIKHIIEVMENVIPYISESIILKGVYFNSKEFKSFIESVYNTKKLSLIDWWINIDSNLKLYTGMRFQIKELEISNIKTTDIDDSKIESNLNNLFEELMKISFFSNLSVLKISNNTQFDQVFCKVFGKFKITEVYS